MRPWKRKKVIGRTDCADFPLLKLKEVSIKIDTGAYTSSIHCDSIEEIKKKNKKVIRFVLLDPYHSQYKKKPIETTEFEVKTVRNSFGQDEERYVISTEIILFNQIFDIDLSLSDRSDMKYPILIGRKLLADRFVVDVTKTNLSLKFKGK
ncbi:MAG: peptidase [Flavobacteriales bacterium]|nr:peptidase [Flavobacteriales bacterium]